MKKIGIFGGSFSPPHKSHKAIIEECIKRKIVDEVWVLPSYNHTQKDIIVSFEQRIKMCKMMFCKWFNFKIKVKDYEKSNNDGSMLSLVIILKSIFKDYDFYVIIGSDCADNIYSWKYCEVLLEFTNFIVFNREDYFPHTTSTWYLKKPHQFIEVPGCFLSSTYIRKLINKNYFNLVRILTNKKISNFIKKEKLYANSTD